MKVFEASINRLLKNEADNLTEEQSVFVSIPPENELSLQEISDGFERENRRYLRSLELTQGV